MKKGLVGLLLLGLLFLLVVGCSPEKQVQQNNQPPVQNKKSDVSSNQSKKSNDNTKNNGSNDSNKPVSNDKNSSFYATFQLAIPGVSYTTENAATDTITVHSSAGVESGGLQINPDGTYIWNSSWDEKIIKGKWKESGDTGYPILLLKGEEGKDWKVGLTGKNSSEIYVWDGNAIYHVGKKVK